MPNPNRDFGHFEEEYRIAALEFKAIRAQHTRKAFCGRSFVLVPKVTEQLLLRSSTCHDPHESDLERLRVAAYMSRWRLPPAFDMSLDRLMTYLAVFYTLLDLDCPHFVHLFAVRHLHDDRLPLSRATIKETVDREVIEHIDADAFYENFYQKQFEWCPVKFEIGMGEFYSNRVIPGYRRDQIHPLREDLSQRPVIGHDAQLWFVEIPEELAGPSLLERLPNARRTARDFHRDPHPYDRNPGQRYQLALKTFPCDKRKQFDDERRMFTALDGRDGIIQYIGWYQSIEADETNETKESYTIVLERAQFDLYKVFREEAPPVTPVEIHDFWDAMLDVAKALRGIHHDLTIDNLDYDMWHGDIKPENILRVDDCFKLADPGEGRIKLATNTDDPPKADVPGGTRTYAAPEKSAYLNGRAKEPEMVLKSTDVWSLGCVFSVAATFLVLGKEGVQQYDRIRRHSILKKTNEIGDAFHDGEKVLDTVIEWHQYLRRAARRTDAFTAAILDKVDTHMLQAAEKRWDAKQLCDNLEVILSTDVLQAPDDGIPPGIEAMLQEIDVQEEFHHERSTGIRRVDSDEAGTRLPEAILPSGEQLSGFKTKSELYAQRLLPTAQRSQGRTFTTHSGRDRRLSTASSATTAIFPRRPSQTPTASTVALQARRTPTVSSETTEMPQEYNTASAEVPFNVPFRIPITIWQVQAELEASGKSLELPHLRNFRFSSLFRKREHSVLANKHWQQETAGKEDPLQPFLNGRDIVYLVDNGSTMYYHWAQLGHWMRILTWRSMGYDNDGMELYFTNPDTTAKVPEGTGQSVEDFVNAIRRAKPQKPVKDRRITTDIAPKIRDIVNAYMTAMNSKNKPKSKTIIVLTDGAWQGMQDEYTMDNCLKDSLRSLMESHADMARSSFMELNDFSPTPEQLKKEIIDLLERTRPVTLQFVRFGHDEKGMERLRRLDDDLKGDPRSTGFPLFPDLVDTEPADGDVYKMFCGSLFDYLDHTTTVVSTVPSTASLSPRSSHREGDLIGGRSRSGTAATEDDGPSTLGQLSTTAQIDILGAGRWLPSPAEPDFRPSTTSHRSSDSRPVQERGDSLPTQALTYGMSAQNAPLEREASSASASSAPARPSRSHNSPRSTKHPRASHNS